MYCNNLLSLCLLFPQHCLIPHLSLPLLYHMIIISLKKEVVGISKRIRMNQWHHHTALVVHSDFTPTTPHAVADLVSITAFEQQVVQATGLTFPHVVSKHLANGCKYGCLLQEGHSGNRVCGVPNRVPTSAIFVLEPTEHLISHLLIYVDFFVFYHAKVCSALVLSYFHMYRSAFSYA